MNQLKIPDNYNKVLLAKRPVGLPKESDFRLVKEPIPIPKEGEILVRAHYLSADPFQRMRLEEKSGYGKTLSIGDTILGRLVGDVVSSNNPDFIIGDFVEGMLGWQEYAISDCSKKRAEYAPGITKIDPNKGSISAWLGILGFPGITAYFSLLETGKLSNHETVLVSAAAGAVGSIVGQIAKIMNCTVIGITSTKEKSLYIKETLGFDEAISYKETKDITEDIKSKIPQGIDVFIDNTGGDIADSVLPCLKQNARVVLVGNISQNNIKTTTARADFQNIIMSRRVTINGFIVYDFEDRADEARKNLNNWLNKDKIQFPQTIELGIQNAPKAFISMLNGKNIGKQLIRLPISQEKNT